METDDLMIAESTSSLHLTVSHDEEDEVEPAPGLSKLSSSCSASDDESGEEHESSPNGESASAVEQSQSTKEDTPSAKSISKAQVGAEMGSRVSKEEEEAEGDESSKVVDVPDETTTSDETAAGEPNKTDEATPLEILNSEQQGDGSLHIEVKDDGCGDPEEGPGAKIQRLARKAGIIVGGGTMTAVGTVMLFLPCPTPSIYLMIGGMAIMSKEVPAAQRQLDITRGNLEVWVDRAEKEFAQAGRTINVVVDSGSPKKKEATKEEKEATEEEEKEIAEENEEVPKEKENSTSIASTQVVYQAQNPVKKHLVKSCRNVILPLLSKVCTPQEEMKDAVLVEKTKEDEEAAKEASPEKVIPQPETPSDEKVVEEKENAEPWENPFVRWARFRENRRKELMKLEEQKEREAMLARINETNLQKLQEDFESSGDDVVQEVPTEEEDEDDDDEEEEETPPSLTQVQETATTAIRV